MVLCWILETLSTSIGVKEAPWKWAFHSEAFPTTTKWKKKKKVEITRRTDETCLYGNGPLVFMIIRGKVRVSQETVCQLVKMHVFMIVSIWCLWSFGKNSVGLLNEWETHRESIRDRDLYDHSGVRKDVVPSSCVDEIVCCFSTMTGFHARLASHHPRLVSFVPFNSADRHVC